MRESTNRVRRAACAAVAALLFLSPLVPAQSATTGTLKGLVRDATGAVLPGVTVKARDLGTGARRETVSDDQGRWTLIRSAARA